MNILGKTMITVLAMISFTATAGTGKGEVTQVWVSPNDPVALFAVSGDLKDTPRCNEKKAFAINLMAPGGDAVYQSVLKAKTNGWMVAVEGLNTCRGYYEAEDLKEFVIQ